MRRILNWVLLIGIIGSGAYIAYTNQGELQKALRFIQGNALPCTSPITYSLGSIDSRFGISAGTLIADLEEAENIWEKPTGKNLFEYVPSGGDVTVNLIYDNRQAATDKLRSLGIQTGNDRASYDALKASYDALSARIETERSTYKSQVAAYKQRESAYNAEIERWNKRGGAPKADYERLQTEKAALAAEFASVKSKEEALNADIDTLNALATTINQLIVQLNLKVDQYNSTGASLGEFEEGLYQRKDGIQTIDIYEYSDHVQLVRVLGHEIGHALGLNHVADPEAVMYKINSGKSLKATEADILELNKVCKSDN